jgi:carboxyl-terminal processing protease
VGSKLSLTVVHDGLDKPFEARLVREENSVSSVKSRSEGRAGYIRIAEFDATTAKKLKEAAASLQSGIGSNDLLGFVLDLRNDPVGQIDQAAAVADAFLDAGEIASTRGRKGGAQHFPAHAGDIAGGKPLIVLINGGTGSAAEVVAAALKENHRGAVVGTLSFGIGSLQSVIPFGADGELVLTTAHYYTPAGHLIEGNGVAPDIEITEDLPPDLAASSVPVNQPKLKPTLKADSQPARGSPGYVPPDAKNDKQLIFAFDLLTGKQTNPAFPPTTSAGADAASHEVIAPTGTPLNAP